MWDTLARPDGLDAYGLMTFLATLPAVPWLRPQGPPDPAWHVFLAPSLTAAHAAAMVALSAQALDTAWFSTAGDALDALRAAARAAARDTACLAAWNDARDMVFDTVWDAALEADRATISPHILAGARRLGWRIVWDPILHAAWEATRAGANAAGLVAAGTVCAGLPQAEQHLRHHRARWQVWLRGYALLGESADTFYVYGVEGA